MEWTDLLTYLQTGENQQTKFIGNVEKDDDLGPTIIGLVNNQGGKLFVGLDITNCHLRGTDITEKWIERICYQCYPNFSITTKTITRGDKNIICISIPEGSTKPYYFKRKSYTIDPNQNFKIVEKAGPVPPDIPDTVDFEFLESIAEQAESAEEAQTGAAQTWAAEEAQAAEVRTEQVQHEVDQQTTAPQTSFTAEQQATATQTAAQAPFAVEQQATATQTAAQEPFAVEQQATAAQSAVQAPFAAEQQATAAQSADQAPFAAEQQATAAQSAVQAPFAAEQQATAAQTGPSMEAPPTISQEESNTIIVLGPSTKIQPEHEQDSSEQAAPQQWQTQKTQHTQQTPSSFQPQSQWGPAFQYNPVRMSHGAPPETHFGYPHDSGKPTNLNHRQIKALTFVKKAPFIKNKKYRQLFSVSHKTAHLELVNMVAKGYLLTKGAGRSCCYVYNPIRNSQASPIVPGSNPSSQGHTPY
ncbi:RNA-binding domain-containing protein [Thermoproteota archaeon]